MKVQIIASLLLTCALFACKKQQDSDADPAASPEFKALASKYGLVKASGSATSSHRFNSIRELEEFLATHRRSETKKVVKDDYSGRSLVSLFAYDSKTGFSKEFLNSVKAYDKYGAKALSWACCGPDCKDEDCHNPDMTFNESFTIDNYDAGSDLHVVTNYKSDSESELTDVVCTPTQTGLTSDVFAVSGTAITVNNDSIHVTFTTTQTNTISYGVGSFNFTTTTDWTVDINTCSHTSTTSYSSSS